MTAPDPREIAGKLTEAQRDALARALRNTDGTWCPAFSTGEVTSLEEMGLCRPLLPWSQLTDLGLLVREHLRQGDPS